MASKGIDAIVSAVPPPGKLGGGRPAPADDEDEAPADDEYAGDEDKAAEVAALHSFAEALGVKVADEDEACAAFKRLIAVFDKDDEGE